MLGFTNDLGRMNAIVDVDANLQLCVMKAFAREDWRPKGGFPKIITGFWFVFVFCSDGTNVRKSCFIMLALPAPPAGSISIPILSYVSGMLFKKAPLPADGSTHR